MLYLFISCSICLFLLLNLQFILLTCTKKHQMKRFYSSRDNTVSKYHSKAGTVHDSRNHTKKCHGKVRHKGIELLSFSHWSSSPRNTHFSVNFGVPEFYLTDQCAFYIASSLVNSAHCCILSQVRKSIFPLDKDKFIIAIISKA